MRCHYEVLAVERAATPAEIKKAFHKSALKWHPDKHQKNNISSDEATLRFQEIQSAYEVLSDAQERKWYDDHREQILRGDDGQSDGVSGDDELNLFKYFSPTVYSGFGDDPRSFYSVYGELFAKLDGLDMEASEGVTAAPVLGDKQTPMDEVLEFYQHWQSYVTPRSFSWMDEYKTTDAPSRAIRRAMEKENKKLRNAAKKAFTTEVRELVDFVRRRDQRMIAFQKQKEKEKEQQRREEEAKKKAKQAAYETERLAFQQQERERWENESMQTSRHTDQHIEEELEKLRKKLDADVLLCDICRKTFKSPKQLNVHLTSKKHRDMEIELGVTSEFMTVEDALDADLQAELAEMKRNKAAAATLAGDDQNGQEQEQQVETEEDKAKAEAEAAALEAAMQLRLEKEQKAADKRKERKEQRKEKKKSEVEKIVSKAKAKNVVAEESDQEDGGRRKKGSRRKR